MRRLCATVIVAAYFAVPASSEVPVFDASNYTTVVATHPHGILQLVRAPDAQPLPVLHLFGNASERGEAAGELMADDISNFITKVFDDYVVALVESVKLGGLPEWIQKALEGAVGKSVAAPLLQAILKYISGVQGQYVHAAHDSTTHIFDEINGIARGVCKKLGTDACIARLGGEEAFAERILHTNYLPETIRMACSMAGATRTATAHGKLVQLRTLDFGSVPFANHPVLVVHHQPAAARAGDASPSGDTIAFAMVGFPAFVGAVTGLNSAGIVQSEKVNYDARSVGYNTSCVKPGGVDIYGCIPGTYDGEASPTYAAGHPVSVVRSCVNRAPRRTHACGVADSSRRPLQRGSTAVGHRLRACAPERDSHL
jgi:hypothetical protein